MNSTSTRPWNESWSKDLTIGCQLINRGRACHHRLLSADIFFQQQETLSIDRRVSYTLGNINNEMSFDNFIVQYHHRFSLRCDHLENDYWTYQNNHCVHYLVWYDILGLMQSRRIFIANAMRINFYLLHPSTDYISVVLWKFYTGMN